MAHGGIAQAGKVKGLTPHVDKTPKKKKLQGRAGKRLKFNRRYVNGTMIPVKNRPQTQQKP